MSRTAFALPGDDATIEFGAAWSDVSWPCVLKKIFLKLMRQPDSARRLELLAPARNAELGEAAIVHGADAVYIGGPAFGARATAGNPIGEIARLAAFAHRYSARVYVALNTLLHDDELDAARRMAWQAYDAGADALIVQDMGLLEIDLPPIALHASTQCDNRAPEKVKFLEDAGFSQVVLARELELPEIRAIAEATSVRLEFFVFGALCVSYSGRCAISQACTGRSANRGECAQFCRLPWDVSDAAGKVLARGQHVLSLKDNDQSANLRALIDAGVSAFKIEGRMKDVGYVKNVTAHWRRLLDALIDGADGADAGDFRRASAGRTRFFFTPQLEKTFNRGVIAAFVGGRPDRAASLASPKFAGEAMGRVTRTGPGWFEIDGDAALENGDGFTWIGGDGRLAGMRASRVDGRRVKVGGGAASARDTALGSGREIKEAPSREAVQDVGRRDVLRHERLPEVAMPTVGTLIARNHDQAFTRLLAGKTAERRIGIGLVLSETEDGFRLDAKCGDDGGGGAADDGVITVSAFLQHAKEPARNAEGNAEALRAQLAKLGGTIFAADEISIAFSQPWFLTAAAVNALRRDAVARLEAARAAAYARPPRGAVSPKGTSFMSLATPRTVSLTDGALPGLTFPVAALGKPNNVLNRAARAFYARCGASEVEAAVEAGPVDRAAPLMLMRHCLRYELGICPKQARGARPDSLFLSGGGNMFRVDFDCRRCEAGLYAAESASPETTAPHPAKTRNAVRSSR